MPTANWPGKDARSLIGKRIDRLDGPAKATGRAQYSYDVNLPGMLWARVLASPHARAKVKSIDTTAAEAVPGVVAAWKDAELINAEIQYAGQIVAAVAAESEEIATDALEKIKVDYEPLEHQVIDDDPKLATAKPSERQA